MRAFRMTDCASSLPGRSPAWQRPGVTLPAPVPPRLQRNTGGVVPIRPGLSRRAVPPGRLERGPVRCSRARFPGGAVLNCWGGGASPFGQRLRKGRHWSCYQSHPFLQRLWTGLYPFQSAADREVGCGSIPHHSWPSNWNFSQALVPGAVPRLVITCPGRGQPGLGDWAAGAVLRISIDSCAFFSIGRSPSVARPGVWGQGPPTRRPSGTRGICPAAAAIWLLWILSRIPAPP